MRSPLLLRCLLGLIKCFNLSIVLVRSGWVGAGLLGSALSVVLARLLLGLLDAAAGAALGRLRSGQGRLRSGQRRPKAISTCCDGDRLRAAALSAEFAALLGLVAPARLTPLGLEQGLNRSNKLLHVRRRKVQIIYVNRSLSGNGVVRAIKWL